MIYNYNDGGCIDLCFKTISRYLWLILIPLPHKTSTIPTRCCYKLRDMKWKIETHYKFCMGWVNLDYLLTHLSCFPDYYHHIIRSWSQYIWIVRWIFNFLYWISMALKYVYRNPVIFMSQYFRFLKSHILIVLSFEAVAIFSSYLLKSRDITSPLWALIEAMLWFFYCKS